MGMDKHTTDRIYAFRVERLIEAVQDLEECALAFPETRDKTVELLDMYCKDNNKSDSGKVLRRASDEIAAVGMLEILHEA